MLQLNTRSKDLKTQKMQGCILEAVGAISPKPLTHFWKQRIEKIYILPP